MSVEVPAGFARDIVAREGDAGRAWVAALPAVVDGHCARWDLTVTGVPMHGLVSLVVPVRLADGSPAVLKVGWPHEEARWEALVLAAWAGRGSVRLLAADPASWTLMLERLHPERTLERHQPVADAVAAIGELSRQLSAAPAPAGLTSVAEVAERWAGELPVQWEASGRPIPRRQVDVAVAACRDLGPSAGDVLLHGDLHFANVLAGERAPWLAIDPKPLLGEPAWDVVAVLWNRWAEAVADGLWPALRRRLDVLCETSGADRERALRWAQARAVDDVLDYAVHGVVPSVESLALAELLAG